MGQTSEILQEPVDEISKSSGGSLGFFYSVDELDSLKDVGQDIGSVEQPPFFLGGLHQLVHHRQAGHTASAALGLLGPQTDRGEGAFDWVGRPQVFPVLGWKVIEGQ